MHGLENRGLDVPRGVDPPRGRFGRMFPNLPVRPATGLGLATKLGLPGGLMDGGQTTREQENPEMDAGIMFLGQFIDHTITFDPSSSLAREMDPTGVRNFRAPRLDLDHLYGSGPGVDPFLYDTTSHGTKLALDGSGVDLARTGSGVALIGDPRNDENLMLAQLHLAFIKFHNRVVDELAAGTITDVLGNRFGPPPDGDPTRPDPDSPIAELLEPRTYYDNLLAAAQQLVRWHFQWIVVHEFLPTVCGDEVVSDVLRHGRRYYRPDTEPFIPVEFSVAAFRFGHPTLRSKYVVNDGFTAMLFPTDPGAPPLPRTDLRGGPVTARFALDYSRMFSTDDNRRPQRARRITAEVLIGLLDFDPTSYLTTFPGWRPTLALPGADNEFGIADLLHHAGVA